MDCDMQDEMSPGTEDHMAIPSEEGSPSHVDKAVSLEIVH